MSSHSIKTLPLNKTASLPRKELYIWMESLSTEQKCRVTRVHSTQLVASISKRLADLGLGEEGSKHSNHKKQKPKGDCQKGTEDSPEQNFFDCLMVFSESGFLDSLGLDYNMIKDSTRMFDILYTLSMKSEGFNVDRPQNVCEIRSKEDIGIFVSTMILKQLEDVMTTDKFPLDHSMKRRDIGNLWARLEASDKLDYLLLENSDTSELHKTLHKKGIQIPLATLQKEVAELLKQEKNQFCNRLMKCRLKKLNDPAKMYHHKLYRVLVERIKHKNKKRSFKKEQTLEKQIFSEKQEEEKVQVNIPHTIYCNSPSKTEKQSVEEQSEQRAKSFSVSSNDTNQTESPVDSKVENYFSKRVETLYQYKIVNDLQEFGDIIGEKANSYQKYRLVAFNRVQCIMGLDVELILFGSCANGLMIERSDLDIAITHSVLNYFAYGSLKERVVYALTHFHGLFLQQPWILKSNLITTASIPVLKLEIDTSMKIQNPQDYPDKECMLSGYPDGVKIEVDITVDTSPFQGESQHLGLQATQSMNSWMGDIPNLYSMAILLKYIFQKKEFNSTYKGGMGSFCAMVMIMAYLKHHKKESEDLCSQMVGLLNFYSLEFNDEVMGVDIRDETCFYVKQNPQPKLQIKDPLNGRTMTRNTYLYPKIKEQLAKLYKKCFSDVKQQILDHVGSISQKEERQYVLGLSPKEYYKKYSTKYSKNVFYEYDLF